MDYPRIITALKSRDALLKGIEKRPMETSYADITIVRSDGTVNEGDVPNCSQNETHSIYVYIPIQRETPFHSSN